MTYSIRILNQDIIRLKWLLSNDDAKDNEYTFLLKRDISDLETSIKHLKKSIK